MIDKAVLVHFYHDGYGSEDPESACPLYQGQYDCKMREFHRQVYYASWLRGWHDKHVKMVPPKPPGTK